MDSGLIGLLLSNANVNGDLRLIGTAPPNFAVDADGTMVGQSFVLDSRLRTGLALENPTWKFVAQADLLSGQILGDPWDLDGSIHRRHLEEVSLWNDHSFVPRKMYVQGAVGKVVVQAGLSAANWGLGIVANDGDGRSVFGRTDYGDRVIRLGVSAKVNPVVTFSTSADAVLEDDMAFLKMGQRAYQSSTALLGDLQGDQQIGFLFVYRWQEEADERSTTQGYFADLYGYHPYERNGYTVALAYEGALIQGRSQRFTSYNYPNGLGLVAQGAAAELSLRAPEDQWSVLINTGFASGDGDPDDGTAYDFSFDRDYNAGILLYDYYQSAIEVGVYNQLTDPENVGYPPDGVEAAVTEGAIRRSAFVNPMVVAFLSPWCTVKAGALFAWSTAPISQGFQTFRNGGVPVNHLGRPTEGYHLGNEFNWGVELSRSWGAKLKMSSALEVQGGHAFLSESYGNGEVLHMVALQGNLQF